MKCEVIVNRLSLVVGKGSIVEIDERQWELARQFVKPIKTANEENEEVVEKPKKAKKK